MIWLAVAWVVVTGLLLLLNEHFSRFVRTDAEQLRWKCKIPSDPGLVHRELKVGGDGTVYALGNTVITAVSSDAKKLGTKPLGGCAAFENLGQLELDDDFVYTALGGQLRAFPLNGKTQGWTAQHSHKDNMYVAMARHRDQLHVFSGKVLSTYSLKGKLIRRRTFSKHTESSMATDALGNLFLSVAGHGADLNSYQVLALDPDGTELWRVGKLPPVKDVVFGAGRVYVGTNSGLFCFDPQGHKLWSLRQGWINNMLIDAAGIVYCTFDGKPFGAESLCALDGSGKQLWLVNNIGGALLDTLGTTNPVIWQNRIYIATSEVQPPPPVSWVQRLLTKWSAGNWSPRPRAHLEQGRVMALDLATGQLLWDNLLPEPLAGDLTLDKRGDGMVYASSLNYLYAFEP